MSLLWKLGGVAVALVAAYFLITMYGGARYKAGKADEAAAWQVKVAEAERGKLTAYQAGVASVMGADKQYIETVRERVVPVTERIIERAAEYAQTPDGASICLTADRVRELEAFSTGLFTPSAADAVSIVDGLHSDGVGEER
jgi:hypothetical protein